MWHSFWDSQAAHVLILLHSNSCKNSAVLVLHLRVSKLVLGLMVPAAEAMLGPGHAARLAALPLGVPGTTTTTTRVVPLEVPLVLRAVPLPGLATAATAATAIGTVATVAQMLAMEGTAITPALRARTAVAPLPHREPLRGTSTWAPRRLDMVDTLATARTALLVLPRELVVLLLAYLHRLRLVARRLASPADLTRSSSNTPMPPLPRLRPRRLEMPRRHRRPWTCRLLLRVLSMDASALTFLRQSALRQRSCY